MDNLPHAKTTLAYRDPLSVAYIALGVVITLVSVFPVAVPLDGPAAGLRPLAVVLGVLGLVMAMTLALRGQGAVIDLAGGTAMGWHRRWTFLRRVWRLPLAEAKAVTAVPVWHENKATYMYVVSLTAGEDRTARSERLLTVGDRLRARRIAEEISLACELPLVDATIGPVMVRDGEDLDLAYAGRTERDGLEAELPPPPATARCRCETAGRAVHIDIPPAGIRLKHCAGLLAIVLVASAGGAVFARWAWPGEEIGQFPTWLVLGAASGLLTVALLGVEMLRSRLRRTHIVASPDGLRITATALTWSRGLEASTDQLEEIQIIHPGRGVGGDAAGVWLGGHALFVQAADGSFVFGHGLDVEELRWIKDVLDKFMIGKLAPTDAEELADDRPREEPLAAAAPPQPEAGFQPPTARGTLRPDVAALAGVAVWTIVLTCLAAGLANAEKDEQAEKAKRQDSVAEVQRLGQQIAASLESINERIRAEVGPIQERLLEALRAGDMAYAEELWPPEAASGPTQTVVKVLQQARRRALASLAAFARLLPGSPPEGLSLIPPRLPDPDRHAPGRAGAPAGLDATFGYELKTPDGATHRIELHLVKLAGKWRLTHVGNR